MSLSMLQEEILLVLSSKKKSFYGLQITAILNDGRCESWEPVKNQSVCRALGILLEKGFVIQIKTNNLSNKKFYKITKKGKLALFEVQANRDRIKLDSKGHQIFKILESGDYPIEQMRVWLASQYPDSTNHDPKYERPRRLMAALLRWHQESKDVADSILLNEIEVN